jgi:hypothetical protein
MRNNWSFQTVENVSWNYGQEPLITEAEETTLLKAVT